MALDADRIRKTGRKLRKLMREDPKRPTPEQVHSLRANIRRFEAALEALGTNPRREERRLEEYAHDGQSLDLDTVI